MSQRNPMNDRYNSEEHTGKSRKSAASAKPKTKAASSVVIKSTEKTPKQKKAEAKEARRKAQDEQRALDRKYYTPDTPRYKTLRRIWWALLGGAILCTIVGFVGREALGEVGSMVVVFIAYALIIGAFYVEFSKVRKERRAYQVRMIALEEKQKKAERAEQRTARAEGQRKKGSGKNASRNPKTQAKAAAENEAAEQDKAQTEEAPKKKGLFGGFRSAKREKTADEAQSE